MRDIHQAIDKGLAFLVSRQHPDGCWRADDYGGAVFLVPMYVACSAITGRPIPEQRREGILTYLRNIQNQDGSIGLHADDAGSMFTTALCYVAARLLGATRDDESVRRMHAWVLANGTALGAASWGKFFLALLNLYPYEELHPVLPELWLLPSASPVHPGRMWRHSRQVYMPMAWLYGTRAQMRENALVRELREELYGAPYASIDFRKHRDTVAPSDDRYPGNPVSRGANRLLELYERSSLPSLRGRALGELLEHIDYEDRVTSGFDIGPVNRILNTVVHFFRAPGGPAFERSASLLDAYLCEAPDGLKLHGYHSTAVWDTAFAAQPLAASPHARRYATELARAYRFLDENQVREDLPERERFYRQASKGGWPFSDRSNGWIVTDCTAEGFKAVVELERYAEVPIATSRLEEAIRLLLGYQNRDGGWSSYESQRGGTWLELLNPSQVFSNIMVEHSYVECTASVIEALALSRGRFSPEMDRRVDKAMAKGARFIEKTQRPDGSWEGSWGVCFTYGTWFGVSGLLAAGRSPEAPAIRKACGFLLGRQHRDGGWGESYESCTQRRYVATEHSLPSNTAWGLMTLVSAGLGDTASARRAADLLVRTQQPDGDWPEEPLRGVFNKSTMINYEHYRRYFTVRALAAFAAVLSGDRQRAGKVSLRQANCPSERR